MIAIYTWGQFHQRVYMQLLHSQIPQAQKAAWVDCLFAPLWSPSIKAIAIIPLFEICLLHSLFSKFVFIFWLPMVLLLLISLRNYEVVPALSIQWCLSQSCVQIGSEQTSEKNMLSHSSLVVASIMACTSDFALNKLKSNFTGSER